MKVIADKRRELSQALTSLCCSIREEEGCRRCDFYRSMQDENRLFILQEWDTRKNLMSHMDSDHFRVLRGAMSLLKEPYEMRFHTIIHPAVREMI